MNFYRVIAINRNNNSIIGNRCCCGIKDLRTYTNNTIHYSYNAKGWWGFDYNKNIEYLAQKMEV